MSTAELNLEVTAIEEPAPGVRTLRLGPTAGGRLRPFAPGSHLQVSCGERTNAYSLIGDPRDTSSYAISVLRVEDGSGGSRYLHEAVRPGDVIRASLPRSQFAPASAARRHLLVAAGIGVTPFLSYARAFARTGTPYELHYVHRTGQAPHAELLELPGEAVTSYVGRRAFAAALPGLLRRAPAGTHLSVCGPAAMIDDVLGLAREHGWPEHRLHSERFASVDAPPGEPFTAELARSGRAVEVPADTTLLEALLDAGIDVPNLCRQGVCGECRVGVLAGTPDHHDLHLSEAQHAAGDVLMACVSRAGGDRLELDL